MITMDWKNHFFFYDDSNQVEYRKRVKVRAKMTKGILALKFESTLPSDSGSYVFSYKTQTGVPDQKLTLNVNILGK